MSLLQISKWNYDRNGLEYSQELEDALWHEEANEFRTALKEYLANPLTKLEAIVDLVDAFCDCNFVYYGTVIKELGNTKVRERNFEISLMNTLITEVLLKHKVQIYIPNEASAIELCLGYVIDANDKKPKDKTKNKVKKGSEWIDPKILITDLLLTRGFEEYPEVEVINAN